MNWIKVGAYLIITGSGFWASSLASLHHDWSILVLSITSAVGGLLLMRSEL